MPGLPGWPFSLLSRARLRQSGGELLPQQATDAVMHNIQHSFLHRLPVDILYYLAAHHIPRDSADFLALATPHPRTSQRRSWRARPRRGAAAAAPACCACARTWR